MREEISALYQKLQKAITLHAANQKLEEEQEKIEERRAQLKEEIEKERLLHFKSKTLEKEARLKKLLDELTELTKQTNRIEEKLETSSDEEIERLEEVLIKKIAESYPDAKEAFSRLEGSLKEIRGELAELERLTTALKVIDKELQMGKRVIDSAKERTLFERMLGRHPIVLLSMHLEKAKEEAKKILLFTSEKHVVLFLEKLRHEVERPWNRTLYTQNFLPLLDQFSKVYKESQEKQRGLEAKLKSKMEEEESLIQRYT